MFLKRFLDIPDLAIRGPFTQLEEIRRQMNQIVEAYKSGPEPYAAAGVFPLVNITEDQGHYYLRAELPGIDSQGIDISATAGSISISGERTIPEEGQDVCYHRRERESGAFSRIVNLPGEIDPEKVSAGLINGVLKVVLPKPEAARPRQITVQ